jgi:hypothetical protein
MGSRAVDTAGDTAGDAGGNAAGIERKQLL